MGDYSKSDWTWKQMVEMRFCKAKDIPNIYKGISKETQKPYRFYFRYYDLDSLERASAYLNIGDTSLVREGLKIFRSPSAQFKKAMKVGGYSFGWRR